MLIGLGICPGICLISALSNALHQRDFTPKLSVVYGHGPSGEITAAVLNDSDHEERMLQGIAMFGQTSVNGRWTDGQTDFGQFVDLPPHKKIVILWQSPTGLKPSYVQFGDEEGPINESPQP